MRGFKETKHQDGSITLKREVSVNGITNITPLTKQARKDMLRQGYEYKPSKKDLTFKGVDTLLISMKFEKKDV